VQHILLFLSLPCPYFDCDYVYKWAYSSQVPGSHPHCQHTQKPAQHLQLSTTEYIFPPGREEHPSLFLERRRISKSGIAHRPTCTISAGRSTPATIGQVLSCRSLYYGLSPAEHTYNSPSSICLRRLLVVSGLACLVSVISRRWSQER
jgi:hypothetical protein